MIRTLIIEDEEPAALRLGQMLKKADSDIEIVAILDTVESAVRWFRSNPNPDLIMLDIQLGDGISFEIFRRIKVESYVIFTTAYDEYAIKAFELNSIDYLLKPVDEARLAGSLQKYRKFLPSDQNESIEKLIETIESRKDKFKKRFVVNIANQIKIVDTTDVAFFYSSEKNTFLCTFDKRHYPLEFSLDHIEEMLNHEIFFRINRQYILNFGSISKIDIQSKSRIKIKTNPPAADELLVSSSRSSEFRGWLDK